MVDDVKNIAETAESKALADAIDRARLARERREAEQRKRLDELRSHAAAAQAQREKRDEERRRRQAEQRARDDDRRLQVEERKRAIWEASISRREALLQRERDRSERVERQRASRSGPRPAFAFGSSTPRLLEPLDSAGFFWAARRAASTTNVMFASAPLTRRASALQLDISDNDNKDEPERTQLWSSVARRRTDLVPTAPAPRAAGRAHSMTRLDKLDRPTRTTSMHHLNRAHCRSGETTPSRPGSALALSASVSAASGVVAGVPRRPTPVRRPRPASIAGTGMHTPRGGTDGSISAATTPGLSRDNSAFTVSRDHSGLSTARDSGANVPGNNVPGGNVPSGNVPEVPRRGTPRRPRPVSMHATTRPTALSVAPGEGKPPVHRKPKLSKELDKCAAGSPRRNESPHRHQLTDNTRNSSSGSDKSQVSAAEVTHKLQALRGLDGSERKDNPSIESRPAIQTPEETNSEQNVTEVKPVEIEIQKPAEVQETVEAQKPVEAEAQKPIKAEAQKPIEAEVPKPVEKTEVVKEEVKKEEVKKEAVKKEEVKKDEEKKENAQEKTEEFDMSASMTARRITTEEEAKAALAERRRRARDLLERQADLERQRLEREAEEEAERQRQDEERQKREEEEARELAALQRRLEEEKLRKAIEAQQQLEKEENERRQREEAEKKARLKEEEEKRKAAEEAEKLRREDAEREEKERLARKQRVEAIMARTRLKKQQEEEKKQEEKLAQSVAESGAPTDNGNPVPTADLLGMPASQPAEQQAPPADNGNGLGPDTPHSGAEIEPATKTNGNHVEFAAHNGHAHPLSVNNAL